MILGTDTNENMNSHLLYFSHAMLCNTRLSTGNSGIHVWVCAAALWSVRALEFTFVFCALDVSVQHVVTVLCGQTDCVFSSKDPGLNFKCFFRCIFCAQETVGFCKCFPFSLCWMRLTCSFNRTDLCQLFFISMLLLQMRNPAQNDRIRPGDGG